MDISHPWTKYEIARLRDEERLLRARSAMRAIEARGADALQEQPGAVAGSESLLERLRRLGLAVKRAPAGSGA
jgi:hypothetical protein